MREVIVKRASDDVHITGIHLHLVGHLFCSNNGSLLGILLIVY